MQNSQAILHVTIFRLKNLYGFIMMESKFGIKGDGSDPTAILIN